LRLDLQDGNASLSTKAGSSAVAASQNAFLSLALP